MALSISSNARPTWSTSYSERSISSGWDWSRSGTAFARETEPGAQKSRTACPRSTSASVRVLTTDSTPPYPGEGTEIHGGASIATRSGNPGGVLGVLGARANERSAPWPALGRLGALRRDLRAGAALTASIDAPHVPLRQGDSRGGEVRKNRAGARSPTREGMRWTHPAYHERR